MNQRHLVIAAVAGLVGLTAAPALAAYHGPATFPCNRNVGIWTFDGLYGATTQTAVKAFQKANGLKADGVAGHATQKALGLTLGRTMQCGMGGEDVYALQMALAKKGFWKPAAAKPAAKPTVKPTVAPTAEPTVAPTVEPTAKPVVKPTAKPVVQPTPAPVVEPTPAPLAPEEPTEVTPESQLPVFDVKVGTWWVPYSGYWGGPTGAYDYSVLRHNLTGGANLWFGNVGIGGDIVALNLVNPANAVVANGPFFQPNSYMYDGHLNYRFGHSGLQAQAGYRGLNQAPGVHFGTLALAYDRNFAWNWLNFNAKLAGGSNFGNSSFYDAQAGVGVNLGYLGLDVGLRQAVFTLNGGAAQTINGPTANLKLAF